MSPPPDPNMSPSPPSHLQDTACMVLSWLRSAVPLILKASSHSTTKSRKEHPIQALTAILSDGVVLADLVSYLDQKRLSPTSILRASPRNALSTPLPTPHTTTPIDNRQISVQYENNTRRILYAVRKILDDVRNFTRTPPPHSGAVDAFLGDVTKTPPTRDLRPALRLAELIIACASYGPRHNEFRHALWQFDSEPLQAAFNASMNTVASSVSLPPSNVLFAPGPPTHSPIPSPRMLSPRQSAYAHVPPSPPHPFSPQQIFSPPGRLVTPPVAATPPHSHIAQPLQPFPYPLSPPTPTARAPVYQKPPMPMSPRSSLAPHTASVRSPIPATAPLPVFNSASSPQVRSVVSPWKASPTQSPRRSPKVSRSPRDSASRKSGSVSGSSRGSPRTLPKQAAGNPQINTTSRSVVSPRYKSDSKRVSSTTRALSPLKGIDELREPMKQTSNVTDPGGMVDLGRSVAPDTPTAPLPERGLTLGESQDEGIGIRKFSMVTDESHDSQSNSPKGNEGEAVPAVENFDVHARQVVDGQGIGGVSEMVQRFEEGSNNSKRSSDEFYTPREAVSPASSPLDEQQAPVEPIQETREISSSSARPPKYNSSGGQYPIGHVDEIVRQSVTTSVIKQFTQPTEKGSGDRRNSSAQYDSTSRDGGTMSASSSVYGAESYRSVDFSDPRYMQSPIDAPSPSNRWNMSSQREISHGILSPQPLFSPPQMPRRLRRSSAATQMTPPPVQPRAPTLFRSGSISSQQSYSSAGGYVPPSTGDEDLSKNQKVSFAPVVTTPGGCEKPLGEPLSNSSPYTAQSPRENSQGFSLPPVAGPEEKEAASPPAEEQENTEPIDKEYDDDVAISPQGLQVYDDRDEDVQREDLSEEGSRNVNADAILHSENSFSDKGTIEEVEEYVLCNSDDREEDYLAMGEEEPTFVQEEILPLSKESGIINETEGQTQRREKVTENFSDHPDRETSDLAPIPGQCASLQDSANEDVGDSCRPPERSSEPNLGASHRPPRIIRPTSYSTPGYAGIYRRREVPPTPPSPPAIESLVRSFSDAKRLPESVATREVSTMEPSAGLFEKLISVWQNTDDDQRTELSQSQIVVEGLPSHAASSDPPASQSTQDSKNSTLQSGDLETHPYEVPASPTGSRGRRPRAIRLPTGLKAPQNLSSSFATREEESKSPEVDKASTGSFSDSFFSDGKNHHEESAEEWEAALKGHGDAGVPISPTQVRAASTVKHNQKTDTQTVQPESHLMPPSPSMVQRKTKSHSTSTTRNGVVQDDHLVKVDRRRLDWLTRQLLAARDTISRKDLQMTFAETERAEQREILLLEKQDAQSVVEAMKNLLEEREVELLTARERLSMAIEGVARDRSSAESKTSAGGDGKALEALLAEGHTKLHEHIDRSEETQMKANQVNAGEMNGLLLELRNLLSEAMIEMTQKRDAELNALRSDLRTREKLVSDLQKSSAEMMSQNREMQSEASAIRLEKEKSDHRYKMEMSHVSAQVELVNEFSKKLHDNFRETENLRQQVLHYQDKLSHISSTSGISKRQIKELREAVTRANDECARLRREADSEKRKRLEAIRRAEELEDLRLKDDAVHGRYPDRMDRTDSGSFRSHEPVRPAGHNRPGGSGVNARYHARTRGVPATPTTAQKAWLVIKDKIGGIVTGKDSGTSRRRGTGHSGRRDYSRGGSSQSSNSQSRSRASPRDDEYNRSRSGSMRSRSSQGSGSSMHSAPRSGGSGGRRASPMEDAAQYMHTQPYGREDVERIRATDF